MLPGQEVVSGSLTQSCVFTCRTIYMHLLGCGTCLLCMRSWVPSQAPQQNQDNSNRKHRVFLIPPSPLLLPLPAARRPNRLLLRSIDPLLTESLPAY